MLHLEADHKKLVAEICRQYTPLAKVWVFGSRVTGKNLKPSSDLDLALEVPVPLTLQQRGALEGAFRESSLPFRVDIVDYLSVSAEFRRIIDDSPKELLT